MTDLETMQNPNKWFDFVLPIKRNTDNSLECAVLMGNGPEVFLVNLWDLPKENVESVKFNSFEEIIEAGWIVD